MLKPWVPSMLCSVLLAAKYFPKFRPSRVVIKGDNCPVIDFMTHTGKFRRPDLQRLLSDAQHALAFRLPGSIPRESLIDVLTSWLA